jgi:hypothetical protein
MVLFALTGLKLAAVLAAMGLLIAILMMRSYRYFSRSKQTESHLVHTARPEEQKPRHNLVKPDEMLRWEVQMHETARELSGKLDSKMVALQHLINDADRAAERLEKDLGQEADAPE